MDTLLIGGPADGDILKVAALPQYLHIPTETGVFEYYRRMLVTVDGEVNFYIPTGTTEFQALRMLLAGYKRAAYCREGDRCECDLPRMRECCRHWIKGGA